ncbi:transporter substrate-binding domain-containing protein [Kitasatospora sp. NPDC057015]|uniref:transporter substrate-binding domain-containing protein n=1 Tax=Kitasatospora sp. NPDC057015 TaxID=3346001 RepID=UPI00363E905E
MPTTVFHPTRRLLGATVASALLLLTVGCTSTGSGTANTMAGDVQLAGAGHLKTCTHLPYPPFQSEQNGKVVGFDVDLIDLVAKKLGVTQEIVDTPFENFKTGAFLNSGQCDIAAAGITITAERKKNVEFSVPYFDATQAVLARKGVGAASLADLAARGKKLGTQAQTTGEEYAQKQGFNPVSFESSDALLNGLRTSQVDAVVIDYPVVQGWLKDSANSAAFDQIDNLNTGEQYGFSLKKGNAKLLAVVNQVIAEARADGTYRQSYEKWIGPLTTAQGDASAMAGATPSAAQ